MKELKRELTEEFGQATKDDALWMIENLTKPYYLWSNLGREKAVQTDDLHYDKI